MIFWWTGLPAEGGPVSRPETWLSQAELLRLDELKFLKRRREWLLGRRSAKELVCRALGGRTGVRADVSSVEIIPEPTGAPQVRAVLTGDPLPFSISISHSNERVLVALLDREAHPGLDIAVGADLERIESRSDGFIRDFLTERERAEIAALAPSERPARANGIWSAKEAVLKTLRLGLTVDTWKLECLLEPGPNPIPPTGLAPEGPPWNRFSVHCEPDILPAAGALPAFLGYWKEDAGFILTLAAMTTPRSPLSSQSARPTAIPS